jgi:hypothetical protein
MLIIFSSVCFQVASVVNNTFLALTYSESPTYATVDGDATNNNKPTDLPLYFGLRNGTNCVGTGFIRGGLDFYLFACRWTQRRTKGFGILVRGNQFKTPRRGIQALQCL